MQVVYSRGINEKLLGDFIRKHDVRDKVFSTYYDSNIPPWLINSERQLRFTNTLLLKVASKCGFNCFGDGSVTNSPSHIRDYIEGTIERLGFTPDLYYLHRIDPRETDNFLGCRYMLRIH